jgi:hypothetical protein
VGAGGAGFPTAVKFEAEVGTVVVNAAECEPLLHKDKDKTTGGIVVLPSSHRLVLRYGKTRSQTDRIGRSILWLN